MFQSFTATTTPETAALRVTALRTELKRHKLDGFLVPRADKHQGEYVADCDDRLAYITSFTGSAGHAAILADRAALFIDGRYTIQAADQVDADIFDFQSIPHDKLSDWLNTAITGAGVIGFDPWNHTKGQIETLRKTLRDNITLRPVENLIDATWADRPAPPAGDAFAHAIEYAGQRSGDKRMQIGAAVSDAKANFAVLTLPDSICWLLNMRGADLPCVPVVQCFAIIDTNGKVQLFLDPNKVASLGPDPDIEVKPWDAFEAALRALNGPVLVDKTTAPIAVSNILKQAGIDIVHAPDPCILPKACKNPTELAGATAAHLRDGAAVCNFLQYVSTLTADANVTEIDLVKKLESFRRDTDALKDISFDTICGTGPNGAIVHYRVTQDTNRTVQMGDVLLVDSGGQYLDGTTDITRTIAIGPVSGQAIRANTLVLKGMINVSKMRFPKGLSGRDIDPIARQFLWSAGMDFDHGTGHGVGSFLSVHEGPQGISRRSMVPLQEGMIISNEPGYYKQDAFGIRIENLIYVKQAAPLGGADEREMLQFETLTLAPIDRAMIDVTLLSEPERKWLNKYHATVLEKLQDLVNDATKNWLKTACAPL